MHEGLSRSLTALALAFSRMASPSHTFRNFARRPSHLRQRSHRAQLGPPNRIRGPPLPNCSRDGARNDAGPDGCTHRPDESTHPGTPPAREAEKGHVHVIPYTTSRFARLGMPSAHFRPYPNPKSYP
jgi:hypothetical protein